MESEREGGRPSRVAGGEGRGRGKVNAQNHSPSAVIKQG